MTKEKMILKIKIEPKEIPCHDCVKGCMGDEFMRCKKLKAHNKKITAKEYDYDKAIEVMAEEIFYQGYKQQFQWKEQDDAVKKVYRNSAKKLLNALLERGEYETD